MSALRIFLAIDVPPHARETIVATQNRFKKLDFNASWVQPGNIHLTLKFLGDTPARRMVDIKKSVSSALGSTSAFKIALYGLGVFPNFENPRILWISLEDPHNHLKIVKHYIDEKMELLGFPKEKKFDPHITLARIKHKKGVNKNKFVNLKQEVDSVPLIKTEPFQVDSVKLIHSELTPKGSIYKILGEFSLGQDT